MSKMIKDACCGNCLWFDGDETDNIQFCNDNEKEVSSKSYCYRYSSRADFERDDENEQDD